MIRNDSQKNTVDDAKNNINNNGNNNECCFAKVSSLKINHVAQPYFRFQ